MPVLTGPSCVISDACPAVSFPQTPAVCKCDLSVGGINDVYFIQCDQQMTETNITDLDWWNTIVTGALLGRIGVCLGSISKKSDKRERVGSCRTEQITSATWALKIQIKCFDKTSADTTTEQMNTIITNLGKFVVAARMCEGDDSVLPIGVATVSDFNWTVPDNNEDTQILEVELSWKELGKPKVYSIAGLSTILPKAA